MIVIWRPEALDHRDEILAFIAERNWRAADRLYGSIEACLERLLVTPAMYRPGRVSGTREAVIRPNYVLIYQATANGVEVVDLIHARRNYP